MTLIRNFNHSIALLPSAARVATINSADQENLKARGLHVIIDVTLDPAAASITPTIQSRDPLSGTYHDLLVGNAIVAVGTTILKVYPGIAVSANAAASDILPRVWRLRMVHADGDSITYSVGAELVI